jgi:hypothetical protein
VLNTAAGVDYDVSFWVASTSIPDNLKVVFGSTVLGDVTDFTTPGWQFIHASHVKAVSNFTSLTFSGYNLPDYVVIDNISVKASTATPEPGVWTLAFGVTSAAAFAARRRTKRNQK